MAILTRDYPPAIGGIATHVEGLVRALRHMGVEADLYVGRNDVKTLLFPFDIPLKEYDVVHAQSSPYGAFVFGVPLVVTVHSPVMEEFSHYRSLLKAASIPAIALERVSFAKARRVLAVSEKSRSDICGLYGLRGEKVQVIGNGVDYERFSFSRAHAASDLQRILIVSRLEPRKNVEEAIQAIAELNADCQLDIAGDGSQMGALVDLARKLQVQNSVHFLGRVDGEELPRLYSRSAIFLTTSHSEGFGLSLLEAMSAGCACVASDLPTHRALIADGANGMIYHSKAELVFVLKGLLSSPQEVERFGSAAKKVAAQHTWERVASKVADTYESVSNSKRRI